MKTKKIGMACDHAGYEYKEKIKEMLQNQGFLIEDFGTYSTDSCDYPDFAHKLAFAVENKTVAFGISLCGSGNGINITANKHQGVRSALCWTEEISRLARLHNDANICAMPARFISFDEAKKIIYAFMNTSFEGGRHTTRIEKIPVK
ncbi:MAG TPA: ribose 5-phosphate isomerase B [Bacteroidales bacterium]|nr:MAG: ribose 5-phosphate isomerase B [Bacteroidetes bacterium GWF2_33_38]OFY68331.1 MAG: ribose 5-phosphate isomerase B [Bacteroidetes bacterium RIFOXYA12_FULL_33_9]OFY86947.1 MAG: ribose 5-phosphate isomerase B [Bacteroidetes bacterium RIFOXYA2_FULL_33_7]HBF87980.1 ribose 5-phosphate isomerase B [Bacteroidales bacterium]